MIKKKAMKKKPINKMQVQDEPVQKIETLEEIEQVRLRPGNFIPNINYTVYELADNSIDEFLAGYGSLIDIEIKPDQEIIVTDRGRGLPVTPSDKYPDKSEAEIAFSNIRSGGKFRNQGIKSAGLHGIGAAAINFLSEYFDVTIKRDGIMYHMRFEKGVCVEQLHEIGTVDIDDTGTSIICKPDKSIWEKMEDLNIPTIKKRLRQICFLNPNLTINFKVEYDNYDFDESYNFENGINEYLNEMLHKEEPITEIYNINKTVPMNDEGRTLDMDIAFCFTEQYTENIIAFTNNVANTAKRSSHITGFKNGLANAIKDAIEDSDLNKAKFNITSEDTREGVIAIISIKVSDPFYEGQGKDILTMPEVKAIISNTIEEYIIDLFDKNPTQKEIILKRVIEAARVRESVRKFKETTRKVKSVSSGKVEGLIDCIENDPDLCELYLVEGDSAAGSAKNARDKNTMAILPVFGKINNTFNMELDKILKSTKIMDAVRALGCGIDEEFDIDNLKYRKIVLLTDADVDGLHIRCLWMTFFYVHMKELIEEGCLYISLPPLYTITLNPRTKKEEKLFAFSDNEKDEMIKGLKCKYEVSREKGLGEMDWQDLKASTMDPNTRKLKRVTIKDIESCMNALNVCMNDREIAARKSFILNRGL